MPDDGAQHLCDCDVWVIIGDLLDRPLLPVRKHIVMDCEITWPMLLPEIVPAASTPPADRTCFVWSTNEEHLVDAASALLDYYQLLDGRLECHIIGANARKLLRENEALAGRVRSLGECSEAAYQRELANAAFLWQPARIENGAFSMVEAACMGVPSLSIRYPAMEEVDARFGLDLTWLDSGEPSVIASRLHWMDENRPPCVLGQQHNFNQVAGEYWSMVRECL